MNAINGSSLDSVITRLRLSTSVFLGHLSELICITAIMCRDMPGLHFRTQPGKHRVSRVKNLGQNVVQGLTSLLDTVRVLGLSFILL